MRHFLTFKAGLALVLVAALLTAGYLYANALVFDVNVKGKVQLALSTQDPLVVLSGDGQTLIGSGDTLDFGTVEVDYWGTSPVPVKRVTIKNTSSTPELVIVTGDLTDGVLPLFGLTKADLKPAPGNAFRLEPAGDTGDSVVGWIGLQFRIPPGQTRPTTGSKHTTIIIRASEIPVPVLASELGFENPTLGQPCVFSDASPLGDEYLQSHGVSFRGDSPINGLAILHECSNLGISSHSTGDYFLAGSKTASMASGGVPWLPEVVTFSQPVSEVRLFGCSCGSIFGSYTLSLHGYDGPDGTGTEIAMDSRPTTNDWQMWRVVAPTNATIRSIVLSETGGAGTLVLDDLEWKWVEQ